MKSKWLIALLALGVTMPVVAVTVLTLSQRLGARKLPNLGELPEFQLTERSGHPITKESLAGKVWVADFIYTSCAGQCPVITQSMELLQQRLRHRKNFRLVSITVDPETDTPEVLSLYADAAKADSDRWLFLTGEEGSISSLVQTGFHLAMGDPNGKAEPKGELTHSPKLVLVDTHGAIRGYYNGTDEGEVHRLIRDARHLCKTQ